MPTPPEIPRIVENAAMVVPRQCRFPRSKRRRIQKKWSRDRTGRFHRFVPDSVVYWTPTFLIAHPVTAAKLRDAAMREREAWERKWR